VSIIDFANLFQGRDDAWGGDEGRAVVEEVTLDTYAAHLEYGPFIGIYPLRDDNTVLWGCVDIDYESINAAWNLRTVLSHFGIYAYVERSRSKGYHVWVFAREWVDAKLMRYALVVACKLADVPPKEVNPKQTDLKASGLKLGNYVRLPYPGGQAAIRDGVALTRQVVLDGETGELLSLRDFVDGVELTTPSALRQAADLYVPEAPSRGPTPIIEPSSLDGTRLNRHCQMIFDNGPLGDGDRSGALARLAHGLRKCFPDDPGTALVYLRDADLRWGKYHNRAGGERELLKMIERAYR
jgi:hypothetical protein